MVAPPIQNGTHEPPAPAAIPQSETPTPQSIPGLPSLTPEHERLLEAFAQLHSNLDLLSEHADLPLLHLIRWLNQPHIRRYLEVIEEFRANQRKSEAELDRRAALDALKELLATTRDPIEKRRAATTILRALTTHSKSQGTRARPSPAPTSHIPHPTSHIPHPTSLPSKDLSAHETLCTVLSALADDESDEQDRLATLHAFCAKGATIDGQPIPEDPQDFIEDLDEDTSEALAIASFIPGGVQESTPTLHRTTRNQLCGKNIFTTADITLERDSPDHPFLIKTITFLNRNTG